MPLVASAAFSVAVFQRDAESRALETAATLGAGLAAQADGIIAAAGQGFTLAARSIRWKDLSGDELEGAKWLVYRQLEDLAALTVLNEAGRSVGASVFVESAGADADLAAHPHVNLPALEAFAARIPFGDALARGMAVSEPYLAPGDPTPYIAIAVAAEGPGGARWVVAGAVSLRRVATALQRVNLAGGGAMMVKGTRVLLRHGLEPADELMAHPAPNQHALHGTAGMVRVANEDWVTAFSPLTARRRGWG